MFVKQWEEKTTKLNFFSMYFVRNNEEIHLSFKNNEKQRTQALNVVFVSIFTGEYIPLRGFIQEKATMWIRCGFCFYSYWTLVIQSEDFLREKPQCGLNVAFGFYGYCNVYTNQSPC